MASTAAVNANRIITPAEDARGIRLLRSLADPEVAVEYREPSELDSALTAQAQTWVSALQRQPVTGLQLDAMGELYVVAGQDALAQQQFAARLATPGLPVSDRAYTLLLAVSSFSAKPNDITRMQIAARYIRQLDALPDDAARQQYTAHVTLGNAYYLANDGPSAQVHLLHAFSRYSSIPFLKRKAPVYEFWWLANLLSGQPDGRRLIDSVASRILSLLEAPPDLIPIDPVYARRSANETQDFKKALQFTKYLGRPSPPITAQYWWNVPTPSVTSPLAPDARSLRLDDGKIRLIELGSFSCMWCIIALKDMEDIRAKLPAGAEAWYVTRGYGMWGAEPCGQEDEAKYLKFSYLTRKQVRLPIALWIGPRLNDDDGGTLAQNNPMWGMFGIEGGPVFLITDGRGLVRYVGTYSKGMEPQQRVMRFLLAEAAQAGSSARSSR